MFYIYHKVDTYRGEMIKNTQNIFLKKRQGIALFFTLMAIIAITAIVGLTFSYLERTKEKASRSHEMVQLDLYLKEISNVFKTYAKGNQTLKNNFLSSVYTNFSYKDAVKKDVTVNLQCTPLNSRVNINWFTSNDPIKREVAERVFDFMTTQEDIDDAYLLKEKLLAYIGDEFTEKKEKHFIISYSELDDIYTDFMIAASEDKTHINWQDYFSVEINNQDIEKRYLSAKIIAAISTLSLKVIQNE